MPARSTQAASNIYPCLHYRDASAALAWLERAFGFEPRFVMPGPDDSIAHAEMSLGSDVIMVGSAKPEKGWASPLDLPAVNQTICVWVADPDAHYARATGAGAEVVFGLADTDYGARGYTVKDLEGNYWTFSTYRPGGYWKSE
jgi:uncharacterized glyoxalase superfamily protein PhnB